MRFTARTEGWISAAWRAVVVALALSGGVASAQYTHHVYLDTDNNAATGCTVNVHEAGWSGTVTGIERDVQITVGTPAYGTTPAKVTGITVASCSGTTFGTPQTVSTSSWPVGLGVGTGGGDVIEGFLPRSYVPASALLRLYLNAANDVMLSTTGRTGSPLLLQLDAGGTAAAVPALGPFGLTLLGVGIAAVAFGLLRTRAGVAWAMVLALLAGLGAAGVAYAATIIMDGQVADWAGITALGTDPTGDSSIGDPAEDIVAGFATFDASNVYFRVDVRNVSCTPTSVSAPTITPGGPTTFCAGGSVVLTASAGFSSYLWSTGATTQAITVLTAGTYTVQGTNASGCQSPASAGTTVTVTPNVGGSISANPTTVSFGSNSALTINVTNGTSWSLSSSLGNHFGTSGGSGSGTFSSVYSADNNTGTDTVTLTIIGPCGSPTTRTVTITVN